MVEDRSTVRFTADNYYIEISKDTTSGESWDTLLESFLHLLQGLGYAGVPTMEEITWVED